MAAPSDSPEVPRRVLAAFGLDPASVEAVARGHINLTYIVRSGSGERCVLQRVNPLFPPEVNLDFDAIARHLRARGCRCPTLLRTTAGALWVDDPEGCWRLQSFIDGVSTEVLTSTAQAGEAGRLLGRFHSALADLEHEFRSVRSDPHDIARHLAALERALEDHGAHAAIRSVAPVAAAILNAGARITELPRGPLRIVHGDPKISNVMFERETGAAICLVDLDTLGRRAIASELGDAIRSWCNPAGEDSPAAVFSTELFVAAIAGYAAGSDGLLTDEEIAAIPAATYAIAVELAARFCADALNERFFRWNATRFPSASAHNLARARAQLQIALGAAASEPQMHAAIEQAFGAGS